MRERRTSCSGQVVQERIFRFVLCRAGSCTWWSLWISSKSGYFMILWLYFEVLVISQEDSQHPIPFQRGVGFPEPCTGVSDTLRHLSDTFTWGRTPLIQHLDVTDPNPSAETNTAMKHKIRHSYLCALLPSQTREISMPSHNPSFAFFPEIHEGFMKNTEFLQRSSEIFNLFWTF